LLFRDDGDGKIYIAEWNHPSPQPTDQQLRAIPMTSINNLKSRKKHTKTLQTSKIAMLTKNEIDTVVPEEGMLVYNKTDKNVYVYAEGSWKNLLSLLGLIGRIL
jgi:XkdW protein.